MGMFDWVKAPESLTCRKCDGPLTGFQSKDGPCQLEEIPAEQVEYFYTSCKACDEWNEFRVIQPTGLRIVRVLSEEDTMHDLRR